MFSLYLFLTFVIYAQALIDTGRIDFSTIIKKKVVDFNPKAFSTAETPLLKAEDFLTKRFGKSFEVSSSYETQHNGVTHSYFRQIINGLPCFNCWANVNVKGDEILSFGSQFTDASSQTTTPLLSSVEALKRISNYINDPKFKLSKDIKISANGNVLSNTGVSIEDVKPKLGYAQDEESSKITLVWEMVVKTDDDWWDCLVDANTGAVMEMLSWVDDATYRAYVPPISDPDQGERQLVEDDMHTSPLEWHSHGNAGDNYTVTIGNNVYAQENVDGTSTWLPNYRPDGGAALVFDYPVNFNQHPENYMDASITNLFYLNNVIHDILYRYGFDEPSGNFQEDNLGRGGNGVDAVQANAQDGAGMNNANFATPVDGQRPRMRMYLWNTEIPFLDGDFDNSIIMHEYGHGVSNRLTGGPMNVGCLGGGQPGGMGEGWSDFLGTWLMAKPQHTRASVFPMGDYVIEGGIRNFPYDGLLRAESGNPQTYNYAGTVGCITSVHCQGSVWAQILWNVYWDVVDQAGWSADFYEGTAGNNIIMRNVIDGMKLQPCQPTMCEARDAIIEADEINYGGQHVCAMWRGFAERGLGTGQTTCNNYVDSYTVPTGCDL